MPYTTASALLDAARQYIDNTGATDTQLLAMLNTVHARIQREHEFWFQEQVSTASLATSASGFARFAAPTDMKNLQALYYIESNERKELGFLPFFDAIKLNPDTDETDKPKNFSVYRGEVYLFPNIKSALTTELYYTRILPDYVATASDNFLVYGFDTLLYGTVAEYAHWHGEHARGQVWDQKYTDAVGSLLKEHKTAQQTPTSLVARTPGTVLQGATAGHRVS